MSAYYNEFDPKAAAWLRELIKQGHIADGEVDERSIVEVHPDDLRGFNRCHFFAGIGGWDYALGLAGWRSGGSVWTGSPPCQPFSAAGSRKGAADERHLWPVYFRLIAQCRPATLFGEQVAAAIGNGWLDAVLADLEGEGYACAAAVLPACSVGAPHLRQRLWFVAEHAERRPEHEHRENERHGQDVGREKAHCEPGACGEVRIMGHAEGSNREVLLRQRRSLQAGVEPRGPSGASPWSEVDWLPCGDGKARPVEPGTFPLAHGIPARVGRLRGYGNAIVPQVAAEVIGAFMDVRKGTI